MKKTLLTLGMLLLGSTLAQQKDVRFVLDFAVQAPHAPFYLAVEKGYYRAEGLNVKVERGYGSADSITRVASGQYDMGIGDINALIEYNSKNPKEALIGIFMVHDVAPVSIITLKGNGITRLRDLEGKSVAAPTYDIEYKAFKTLADKAGFDDSKVKWLNIGFPGREKALINKETDAISGFFYTSILNLKALGVAPENVVSFPYANYIKGLYGNVVVVRPEFAQQNPSLVEGFLRALIKAYKDTARKPAEGIAALKILDPTIDEALELERWSYSFKTTVNTPNARAFGVGNVRYDRLQENIQLVSEAFALPMVLKPREVFSDEYLPPLDSRRLR